MLNLQAQIDGLAAPTLGTRARRPAAAPPAVAEKPLLVELLMLRGHVLGRIADYERAAELAEQLVRDAPDDATALLARARTRATFHRFAEALADLDAAGRNGADRATLDTERAAILQAVGCYADALVLRQTAADRHPDITTLGALAVLQAQRGKLAEAERLFIQARRRYRGVSPFPVASLDLRRGLSQARRRPAECHAVHRHRPGRRPVLFAAGRTPNTEGLGLEQAGVRLDAHGRIVVDHYYRTTAPGIYAAGDVVKPGLASNAMQQGRAAAHACGLVLGVEIDQTASSAVYGLPEVASVGATEEQIQATGVPYAVGRCDLATTPRGAIAGHGGLLKLIFRADNRKLLGVHCFGDIASEVVGLGHIVLQLGGRVELFLTLALNTPTYSYAYHDATVDGLTRLTELMGVANGGSTAGAAQ